MKNKFNKYDFLRLFILITFLIYVILENNFCIISSLCCYIITYCIELKELIDK